MIKIRNNIFETNSSSIHAICVQSAPVDNLKGIELRPSVGEFGWEHEWYQDVKSRASYIYTLACEIYCKDFENEFCEMLEPYGIKVYKDWDNYAKFKNYGKDDEYFLDNGYVDHADYAKEFVDRCLSDSDYLVRFIFGDESFVMTTNDNCNYDEEESYAEKEAKDNELIWKGN